MRASLAAILLAACWRDAAQLDQVVWADDDGSLLQIELRFEERGGGPGAGTTRKRAFTHQLFVSRPDGGGAVPLGAEAEGQNIAELYLMDFAGYALTGALDADARVTWARTWLRDGERRALDPWPDDGDPGFWLPSPDGAFLAHVRASGSEVRFHAYDTLRETGGTAFTLPPPLDWTWRPDGVFVVTDGVSAQAVQPQGTSWALASVPECTTPKTTSSGISSSGVPVWPAGDGTLTFGDPDPAAAFGCQEAPP